MSAGFRIDGVVFWGTNGAVEAYVEALAVLAAEELGVDSPLATFFAAEKDLFPFMGRIVCLDEPLRNPQSRHRFLALLDAANRHLTSEDAFTESGREWTATVMGELRARVADGVR